LYVKRDAFIGAKRWVWSDDLAMTRAPFDIKVLFDIIEARVQKARNNLGSYYKARSRQLSKRGSAGRGAEVAGGGGAISVAVDVARRAAAHAAPPVSRSATPVDILSLLEHDDSPSLHLLERRRLQRAAGLTSSVDADDDVTPLAAAAAAANDDDNDDDDDDDDDEYVFASRAGRLDGDTSQFSLTTNGTALHDMNNENSNAAPLSLPTSSPSNAPDIDRRLAALESQLTQLLTLLSNKPDANQ
jgi:hypothetical protein